MTHIFWYGEHIFEYLIQMIPCVCLAVAAFFLVNPLREKRLKALHQVSEATREHMLLFFVAFCAGLLSLTMFPSGFWPHIINYIATPSDWRNGPELELFYPSWEEIIAETDYRNLYKPFQEIYRGLTAGPWVFFLLLGNIIMFIPIGFFPALLWRNPSWKKALIYGLVTSGAIEFVQFFIGRSTDIDDILLNTFGALIGYWLFCLIRLFLPEQCTKFCCYTREERT